MEKPNTSDAHSNNDENTSPPNDKNPTLNKDTLSKYGINNVFEEGKQKLVPGILNKQDKPIENFKFGLENSNETVEDQAKLNFEFGKTEDSAHENEKAEFKFGIPWSSNRRKKEDPLNGFKFGDEEPWYKRNNNPDVIHTLPSTYIRECQLIEEFLKRHPEMRYNNPIWNAGPPQRNPYENLTPAPREPVPIIPEPKIPGNPGKSESFISETALQMSKYADEANMNYAFHVSNSTPKVNIGPVFDGSKSQLVPGIIGVPEKVTGDFKFGIESKDTEPIDFQFGASSSQENGEIKEFKFGIH